MWPEQTPFPYPYPDPWPTTVRIVELTAGTDPVMWYVLVSAALLLAIVVYFSIKEKKRGSATDYSRPEGRPRGARPHASTAGED